MNKNDKPESYCENTSITRLIRVIDVLSFISEYFNLYFCPNFNATPEFMSSFVSYLFRSVNYFLVKHRITYLPGMLFVRLSRKIRTNVFKKNKGVELRTITNFAGRLKMCVDRNSYMGGSIYWSGFHHLGELLFLKSFLKPDMTFIDIGANQGEFSIFAAKILTKGKVISFEPVNKQRSYLERNIEINGFTNIEVMGYGLSDSTGEFPIYTSYNTELHAGIHEGLSTLYPSGQRSELEQMVELKVFDQEFSAKLEKIDFIKIDIEGAEIFALKGMQHFIEKSHPAILIELNEETFSAAGYSINEMLDFFSSFNYKSYEIFRGRVRAIEINKKNIRWGNYVFL